MKKVLITVGVIAGVLIIFVLIAGYKMKSETGKMHPVETGVVAGDVYAIRDSFVNMFLVKAGSKYIAIDASDNEKNVRGGLEKLKIDRNDVAAVFLTHTDSDHTGTLHLFEKATVYISSGAEKMINGTTGRFLFFSNSLNRKYSKIKEGGSVRIDGTVVKGIYTPGHTPGSMCYVVNGRYLFVGDAMSLVDGRAGAFNRFFTMDQAMEKESQKKLSGLTGIEYIFTAHYGYTADFTKAFEGIKNTAGQKSRVAK